jgi:RNA polymerase sigma factor for flagellar operon FliA
VTDRTIGRLWSRYLEVRGSLGEVAGDGARPETEREAGQLRDRLVVNYSPLVKYVASRVGARVPGVIEQEDMLSWGVFGLLDAIESYDPDRPGRKAKFESYAISKIRWSILDHLRKQDWVPRRVRERAQKVDAATYSLTQELGRSPTEAEIAGKVGMDIAEYHEFLDRYSRAHVVSLEARMEGDGRHGTEYGAAVADPLAIDPQSQADDGDLRDQLVAAIGELEERERLVATFYFYEGLTLKEIGKALDLTESRVSQILRRALTMLRKHLKGSPLARSNWHQRLR